MINFNNDWDELLADEYEKKYMKNLFSFLKNEYLNETIFPPKRQVFNALKFTPYHKIKVVILGQDPYHQKGQAHGLSFSVPDGNKIPPSLQNIYKEIYHTTGQKPQSNGDLTYLTKQGVLLLNSVLTVRESQPGSHQNKGWEIFTDHIISLIDKKNEPVVFLLWGAYAKKKAQLIKNQKHLVLSAAHPSPLSAYNGFFGCNHFNLTNEFLINNDMTPINWTSTNS